LRIAEPATVIEAASVATAPLPPLDSRVAPPTSAVASSATDTPSRTLPSDTPPVTVARPEPPT